MPAPHQIIPIMEGLISTMPTTASQVAGEWVNMCKSVMRMVVHRNLTNWNFMALSDIDQDGAAETNAAPLLTAVELYGALIATNSADAEADWVLFADADSDTFDGTAALDNDAVAVIQLPVAAVDGTEELHGVVWPAGLPLATGLTVSADGRDGTNPALDDIRGWILFRST